MELNPNVVLLHCLVCANAVQKLLRILLLSLWCYSAISDLRMQYALINHIAMVLR